MSAASKALSPAADGPPRALAPLAPSSTNGPMKVPLAPIQAHTSLTNKEWIVPPRPKPGRKPATDTPPTKRKAQNRAAQRAFRERRASKVGELEEQMRIMEQEDEKEQEELRCQIKRLETDVEKYNQLLIAYGERMKAMEQELLEERQIRKNIQREYLDSREYSPGSADAVPLPSRNISREKSDVRLHSGQNRVTIEDSGSETLIGCGACSIDTRCECIEQAIDISNLKANLAPIHKRPHSPTALMESKRPRHEESLDITPQLDDNEIDFTTKRLPPPLTTFSSSPSIPAPVPTNAMIDSCGFCTEGSTCLCAELAADTSGIIEGNRRAAQLLSQPSNRSISKFVTPASLPNFSFSRSSTSGGDSCQNGPGTCNQCQTSSTSTLFCKSLAATRSITSDPPNATKSSEPTIKQPCSNASNCCRNASSNNPLATPPLDCSNTHVITGPTLSCADAFTALSRHPAFDRASDELGTWLPQLATVPKGLEGRTAFEIEAASVMGVLKFFDRRFGKERDEERK
ncbi:MAG: hypothetical protein Q9187_007271 [Circinaria calcarea]